MNVHSSRGFTLLEVLVALTVLAVALGALFLGIPHIQESAEAALAPKKQPPQDGPAGQDPGWLESPPHPPSPPPDPPSRPHGCDMQGVYCSKNETKAPDHGDGNGSRKKLKILEIQIFLASKTFDNFCLKSVEND